MKRQILIADYNEDSGVSFLKVHTKYGTFSAFAICAKEDRPYQNRYDGFKICEYKIMVKALRAKYHALQERANGIKDVCTRFQKAGWTDKDEQLDAAHDWFAWQGEVAQREADKVKAQYKVLEENFKDYAAKVVRDRKWAREKMAVEQGPQEN